MKRGRFSEVCVTIALSLVVTACGGGDQSVNTPAVPKLPRKPIELRKDEMSSVKGLYLLGSLSYLHSAVATLLTGHVDRDPCRRVTEASGLPKRVGEATARARLVIRHECPPRNRSHHFPEGEAEALLENVRREDRNPRGLDLVFNRATLANIRPVVIYDRPQRRIPVLLVNHSLRLDLVDSRNLIYNFTLAGDWLTPERGSRVNHVGAWKVRVSGQARPDLIAAQSFTLLNLVLSIETELSMGRRTAGEFEVELGSLNLTTGNATALSTCGHPAAKWQGIYQTTLFAGQSLNLDLETTTNRLLNFTTGTTYDLAECRGGNVSWAINGVRAYALAKRSRGL